MTKKIPKQKYLFCFRLMDISVEVFAHDMFEAQETVCKIVGVSSVNGPVYVTANWSCPKCVPENHPCNYPE